MNRRHIVPGADDAAPIREPIPPAPAYGNIDPTTLAILGDFSIVDVETTGVDPDADAIVEVAVLRSRDGALHAFHSLVNPGFSIPPTASAVHHITDEDVAGCPTIDELVPQLIDLIDGSIPVAHNASFDALFVDPALGVDPDPKAWICSMRLAKQLTPEAPTFSNQGLRYWFRTNPRSEGLGAHRAIDDCHVTHQNLLHLMVLAQTRGARSVEDLLAMSNEPIISTNCPFHKYQGQPWADVPIDYIEWTLRERADLDEDLRITLEREVQRRGAEPAPPATVMPFGKHKDQPLANIPSDYLEYMLGKDLRAPLKAGMERVLAARASQNNL